MSKKCSEETRVINYITSLEESLTGKEIAFLKTAFYVVKDNYSQTQYFDIIQKCCEVILENRDQTIADRALFEKMLASVYVDTTKSEVEEIPFSEISSNMAAREELDSTNCLRELLSVFDMNSMDKVKDEIFLAVLRDKDLDKIAQTYHMTRANVVSIYEEKLAVINGVRVVNGKIFVDELENYSTRLQEKISDIHQRVFGIR